MQTLKVLLIIINSCVIATIAAGVAEASSDDKRRSRQALYNGRHSPAPADLQGHTGVQMEWWAWWLSTTHKVFLYVMDMLCIQGWVIA